MSAVRTLARALGVDRVPAGRSARTAALLAATLGFVGAHHWYLGQPRRAAVYAALAWTGIPGLLAAVETVLLVARARAAR